MKDPKSVAREVAQTYEEWAVGPDGRVHQEDAAEAVSRLSELAGLLRWVPAAVADEIDQAVQEMITRYGLCDLCLRPLDACTCEGDGVEEAARVAWAESRGVR